MSYIANEFEKYSQWVVTTHNYQIILWPLNFIPNLPTTENNGYINPDRQVSDFDVRT